MKYIVNSHKSFLPHSITKVRIHWVKKNPVSAQQKPHGNWPETQKFHGLHQVFIPKPEIYMGLRIS